MEKDQPQDLSQLEDKSFLIHGIESLDNELEEALNIVMMYLKIFPQYPLTEDQKDLLKDAINLMKKRGINDIEQL